MKLLLWTLCVLTALTAAISAQAATFTVSNTNDSGPGSLRQAIADAPGGGDTIVFASPLFDSAQTITLSSEIAITSKNLTITGPGADKLTINGGAGTNRIFYILGGTFAASGMTLTGGNGDGAASSGVGGALSAWWATVTLSGLHVTGNSVVNFGGGVGISGGTATISNSTFSANTGVTGSALYVQSDASTTVTNCTFSGNTGPFGAIYQTSSGTMTLQNSTVTNNTGGLGTGGVYVAVGTLRVRSSIVAGNNGATPEIFVAGGTTAISEGYNLIGDSAGDAAKTNIAIVYQDSDIRDTDPRLTALIYYVSTVPVHAPSSFPVSPAIDQGNGFGQATDQRGASRTSDNPSIANAAGGDGTDIGSVELQAPLAAQVSLAGRVTDAFGRPIGGAEVTIQGGNGVTLRVLTSQFGFYRISGIEAGEVYFVSVSARRHSFNAGTRTVTPQDNLADLDFTAKP